MQLIAQLTAPPDGGNVPGRWIIRGAAVLSLAGYGLLAALGDLRARPLAYLAVHAVLVAAMVAVFAVSPRRGRPLRIVLIAAVLFRLVATLGPPALSDDVYRYVWDGRVQLHGEHPYRYAPDDPALERLRDEDWSRINHPELSTIYPPLAQWLFWLLAALGAGTQGFKLAMALADVAVVLALCRFVDRLGLPGRAVVLYAWNPLAVIESAGSGHVEPVGVALVLLAAGGLLRRHAGAATTALAAAVHVKLLPVVWAPAFLRRAGLRQTWLLLALLAIPVLIFAWSGPAAGGGTWAYAERWEFNGVVFPLVRGGLEAVDAGERLQAAVGALEHRVGDRVPRAGWLWLYRHAWPHWLARAIVGLAAVGWIGWVVRRRYDLPRELLLTFGGVLLLSPTLHPWYLLWLLPFAAALQSAGWLLFAALVPVSYLSGAGDVPWDLRAIEYLPPLAVMWLLFRNRRMNG